MSGEEERVLLFVTSNENKVRELEARLARFGYSIEQADIGYPEIQADTLDEVAAHGLHMLSASGERNVIIEDSGLFIDALDGFPGVFSAYVFDTLGNKGILRLLRKEKDRRARFVTVIGMLLDGQEHYVRGVCEGSIALEPCGKGGFGYDPIFIPDGERRTFGEMSREEKNAFS
ncbi:MAG: XTP/dITP diphosphatase, partial [Thermoplasmata archaeon]|nr:XTP/dITP diphosphatase [Thermoplasmata archaeon]